MISQKERFMGRALELAESNRLQKKGGPFGAVIVRNGEIIAEATNTVVKDNDPTAHAEINAIRIACDLIGSFQLDECEIYCSCEPCPMCLGAIYWARPRKIYFAAERSDAEDAGFDDSYIYQEFGKQLEERLIPSEQLLKDEAREVFRQWRESNLKIVY